MKKLYRRFMSVAILSLLVVITLVLVTLNCVNYAKIYKDSYEIIDEIKDNGGKISYEEHNESRYAIRYFTVIVTENTQDVNTSAVHSISKDQALKGLSISMVMRSCIVLVKVNRLPLFLWILPTS